jgi:signal transduction histidine kinase
LALFDRGAGRTRDWRAEFTRMLADPMADGDVDLFVARAEALLRSLLRCDEARLSIGTEPDSGVLDLSGAHLGLRLVSTVGGSIGHVEAWRDSGKSFAAADGRLFARIGAFLADAVAIVTARAEAKAARADLDQVIKTIDEGMVEIDTAFCVRAATEAALGWINQTAEAILGRPFWDIWTGQVDGDLRQALADVLRTRRRVTMLARANDGPRRFLLRVDRFRDGLAVFIRDVTAERGIEERLRQSQKLDAIGQLTSGVAHDVNNMLTVIVSNLETLVDRAKGEGCNGGPLGQRTSNDNDLALATDALRASENAARLVGRLVAFAREQPVAPREMDVGAVLLSLDPLLRRVLPARITLRVTGPEYPVHVLADAAELESAILNLALNAQDAMPRGGVLDISITAIEVDRVYAAVSGLQTTGRFVVLTVADTGVGMTQDVMRQAFQPFFTTKTVGKGTGLGLPMVAEFARRSGGLATIDSESGAGTVVRLYLPRAATGRDGAPGKPDDAPAAAPPPPARPESTSVPEAARGLVMLVEDNDMVRAHTETLLRGMGYDVMSAADGPRAIACLRDGPRPDLLLSDVMLPGGMSGPDVADAAARLVPGLRVLFTSGYIGDVLLRDGKLPPGVALLTKPFRRGELAANVRAQLEAPPWKGVGTT